MGNEVSVSGQGTNSGNGDVTGADMLNLMQNMMQTASTNRVQKYQPPANVVMALESIACSIDWTTEQPEPNIESLWELSEQCTAFDYYQENIIARKIPISQDIIRTYRYGWAFIILAAQEEQPNCSSYFALMRPKEQNGQVETDIIYSEQARLGESKKYQTAPGADSMGQGLRDLLEDSGFESPMKAAMKIGVEMGSSDNSNGAEHVTTFFQTMLPMMQQVMRQAGGSNNTANNTATEAAEDVSEESMENQTENQPKV